MLINILATREMQPIFVSIKIKGDSRQLWLANLTQLIFLILLLVVMLKPGIVRADDLPIPHPLFTDEQVAWLNSQSSIKVGAMNAWPPFNFINEYGEATGIGADYISALNKRLGNKLEIISGDWKDLYDGVINRRIDAILDITPKPEREKQFNFTTPYLNIPHVIVARKNQPFLRNESDLEGKTVAIEKGFGNVEFFRNNYPKVNIVEYADTSLALDAVARSQADAYAGNRSVALYLIGKEVITNLKLHGRLNKEGSILAIGIRKDWEVLADILNLALADIRKEEIRSIQRRWVGNEDNSKPISLSTAEVAWLDEHPEITIAFDDNYSPYSFRDQNGEFTGIAVDVAEELASRLGITLNIYPSGDWQTLYDAALKGEVDVIATLVQRPEREKYFAFTSPYISLTQFVITRKQDTAKFNEIEEMSGKWVALVEGYSTSRHVMEQLPDIKPLYVEELISALQAVAAGKVDATVADIGMAQHLITLNNLSNLGFASVYSKTASRQRFGVRKDWSIFAGILNKALDSLSYQEMLEFHSRYSVPYVQSSQSVSSGQPIELSLSEKKWLQNHPIIRLASDYAWPPFESIDDNNNYTGIAADYMAILEKRLGVKFLTSPRMPWDSIIDMVKTRQLDVFSCAMETSQRQAYASFTSPYISNPMVIITQNDIGYIAGIEELAGKTVGLEKGYASYDLISSKHPDIDIKPYANSLSAMLAVSRGEIDAYIGNIANLSYVTRINGITNIKISGSTPYRFELSLGVRNDWPELVGILQKALDSITEAEHNQISQKWILIEVDKGFSLKNFWQIAVIVLLLLLIFLVWNISLNKKVKDRTSQLLHQAQHDPLTDLPNRSFFMESLEENILKSKQQHSKVAVIYLDLDDFKSINDSLGHEAGDKLLIEAARRLRISIRSGDLVSRLGGDEFVILINHIQDASICNIIAEKILSSFNESFEIQGRQFKMSSSIGISIYPDDGEDASTILSNADAAMYHSKNIGRNVFSYFIDDMNKEIAHRLSISEQIHGALLRNEFECHFQPKVRLPELEVIGFEVLIRWNNETLGQISPAQFIPIAESNGSIIPIGQFVLKEAIEKLALLQNHFKQRYTMAVNISPVQFRDTSLFDTLCDLLKKHGIQADCLELEITEGMLLNEYEHVVKAILQLKDHQVRLSMDDFGTGYSSMSYLRKYPFDSLKIDREFIHGIDTDLADKKLVETSIDLAHGLDLEVVAEGVETGKQVEMLSGMGCDIAQGYFISRPLSYVDLVEFLEKS